MASKTPGTLVTLRPDGTEQRTDLATKPTLEQLQAAVGGYIERVRVRYEGKVRDAYVNEDGLAKRLEFNEHAGKLLAPPFGPPITIVGNLVIFVPFAKKAQAA